MCNGSELRHNAPQAGIATQAWLLCFITARMPNASLSGVLVGMQAKKQRAS